MKIDINNWHAELEQHYKNHDRVLVSKDPAAYFDGFFCEIGLPQTPDFHPIWWEAGIVVYYEHAPTFVFDLQAACWREARQNDQPLDFRVFWVGEEGVFGEVSRKNGKLTEFFQVRCAAEVAEYIDLLADPKLLRTPKPGARQVQVESIIKGVYVPFFRYPDDLTDSFDELPLVNAESIKTIIGQHLENCVPWMGPPLYEIDRRNILEKIKAQPPDVHKIQFTAEGMTKGFSAREWQLREFESTEAKNQGLRQACFEAAASLTDEDVLPEVLRPRLLRTGLQYAYAFGFYHMGIEVGVRLIPAAFPPFCSSSVNPKINELINNRAVSMLSKGIQEPTLTDVPLPSLFDQKRMAFESLSLKHAIRKNAENLDRFVHLAANLPDAFEQRALFENRHFEVDYLLRRFPTSDNELNRAVKPLPFFLEAPLLEWERSTARLKLATGFSSFSSILRTVVLLGLADLRSQGRLGKDPPSDLMTAVTIGNPSLGHWSKWLDWLGSHGTSLSVFGDWVRCMNSERGLIIDLVETRNDKVGHPRGPIRLQNPVEAEEKLIRFFDTIAVGLRRNRQLISVYFSKGRKALGSGRNTTGYEVSALDLVSPFVQFRETIFEIGTEAAGMFCDDQLIAVTDGFKAVVSLNDYFRFAEIKPGVTDILVFEKKCLAGKGLFTGIASDYEEKLKMDAEAFSFK